MVKPVFSYASKSGSLLGTEYTPAHPHSSSLRIAPSPSLKSHLVLIHARAICVPPLSPDPLEHASFHRSHAKSSMSARPDEESRVRAWWVQQIGSLGQHFRRTRTSHAPRE